jgi:hypothetical protein
VKIRRSMSGSSQQPPCLSGVAADCFGFLKYGDSRALASVTRRREHSRCKKSVSPEQPQSSRCGHLCRISAIRVIRALKFSDLPRNELPNPAEYVSERPEMTSHSGKPRKAKTMKRKIGKKNTYESKIS